MPFKDRKSNDKKTCLMHQTFRCGIIKFWLNRMCFMKSLVIQNIYGSEICVSCWGLPMLYFISNHVAVAFRWLYSLLTVACLLPQTPCDFFPPGSCPIRRFHRHLHFQLQLAAALCMTFNQVDDCIWCHEYFKMTQDSRGCQGGCRCRCLGGVYVEWKVAY